jgi:hypothetical protein
MRSAAAFVPVDPGTVLAQNAASHLRTAKTDLPPRQEQLAVATDSIRGHLNVRAIVGDEGRICAGENHR